MDEWETLRRNAKRVEGVLEEKVGAYSRLAQRMHSGGPRLVLLRCAVPRFYRIFIPRFTKIYHCRACTTPLRHPPSDATNATGSILSRCCCLWIITFHV